VSPKRQLVRIVRSPDGFVRPDPTGKAPGRGAYLCADPACWDAAIKKKRLERSLKVTLSGRDTEEIGAYAARMAPVPAAVHAGPSPRQEEAG
jgi:hypothetical protein